ncbi:MAG TPA: hypothetical protein VMW69_14510 [Spirochaetia bacterium]|nr:hypothetical protein [Spirochaetia bacterium]
MLLKISRFFSAMAKGWLILVLLAIFIPYLLTTAPVLKTVPGGNITSLDAQVFYTPQQAFSTIASYGSSIPYWVRIHLTWDLINPLMYTLLLSVAISWLLHRGFRPESRAAVFNLLPLAAGLSDILENLAIVVLLSVYPAKPVAVAIFGTLFSTLKMTFFGLSVIMLLVAAARAALNRFRRIEGWG